MVENIQCGCSGPNNLAMVSVIRRSEASSRANCPEQASGWSKDSTEVFCSSVASSLLNSRGTCSGYCSGYRERIQVHLKATELRILRVCAMRLSAMLWELGISVAADWSNEVNRHVQRGFNEGLWLRSPVACIEVRPKSPLSSVATIHKNRGKSPTPLYGNIHTIH